jgi:hypothetical protein
MADRRGAQGADPSTLRSGTCSSCRQPQPAVSNRHMEGCDAYPGDGIIDQELVERIHCQPADVAAVGVATVSPESALPRRLMLHAARLTSAPEARGQILAPPAGALEVLEQDRTAIRADMAHVEAGGDPALKSTRSRASAALDSLTRRGPSLRSAEAPRRFHRTGFDARCLFVSSSFTGFPG